MNFCVDLAKRHDLILCNTLFYHKMAHRTTWVCPMKISVHKDRNGEIRWNPYCNQIDYIPTRYAYENIIKNARSIVVSIPTQMTDLSSQKCTWNGITSARNTHKKKVTMWISWEKKKPGKNMRKLWSKHMKSVNMQQPKKDGTRSQHHVLTQQRNT